MKLKFLNNFNIKNNLTESDFDNIDNKSQLEHQIQIQETKKCGWTFDKIVSIEIGLYKTGEMNSSNYVKIPLRSSAKLNTQNKYKFCFIKSILAHGYPISNSKKGHATRVSKYKQYFNELNVNNFDFSNGFKFSDVHRLIKSKKLSVNMFELEFHQGQKTWKHKLIPIEISKNVSEKVIELIIYKDHFVLTKKINYSFRKSYL